MKNKFEIELNLTGPNLPCEMSTEIGSTTVDIDHCAAVLVLAFLIRFQLNRTAKFKAGSYAVLC